MENNNFKLSKIRIFKTHWYEIQCVNVHHNQQTHTLHTHKIPNTQTIK